MTRRGLGSVRERRFVYGMPGNGGRALTHSERKWLVEQMASQRRRPVPPDRSEDAEASDPADRSGPAPPAIEPTPPANPARDEAPRVVRREGTTPRREPRAPRDSFWSFG